MTLAQKLKRLRELLLDSAVREEIERTLPDASRSHCPFFASDVEREKAGAPLLDMFAEAIELAQESVAEAAVEKRMNR